MIDRQKVLEIFERFGAIITDSHFIYTSDGQHGEVYIEKNVIFPNTTSASDLYQMIAEQFADDDVETVIGPTVGGAILAQWIGHWLSDNTGREVLSVYADKNKHPRGDGGFDNIITIRPAFYGMLRGKKVLVVDDVLTTGRSASQVVEAVRSIGGQVIGLGALCNRGGVTTRDVANVPKLEALLNLKLETWDKNECKRTGPCSRGVPINTDFGHGQ